MPRIIIDGQPIDCRPGVPVLQAALEAGWNIPHYCYHPALSIVASCRLCLMEMKMPHPKTNEMTWAPKLFPSCQTPVREGMEVRFNSELVQQNQRHVMEDYLLNHPLDCPVCDKAGECWLQDYAEQFGPATSRMVDDKLKNPKKDIGPHTLLYQDRCVLCSRCVRFTQEITGTGELAVVNRGNRCEIDVFPGQALDNPLQGNVVDLCPVGALLDKDFLFKQRVWLLRSTKSVSPVDSQGQTIWIDWSEQGPGQGSGQGVQVRAALGPVALPTAEVPGANVAQEARLAPRDGEPGSAAAGSVPGGAAAVSEPVPGPGAVVRGQSMPGLGPHIHRIRPRYNEKVNTFWVSDEARFGWHFVHRPDRLRFPAVNQNPERQRGAAAQNPERQRGAALEPVRWEELSALLTHRFREAAAAEDGARVAAVLSPFMSCEEAWLLARFIRGLAPRATLAVGHVPVIGEDHRFPKGFVIKAEKCPSRKGVETIIRHLNGRAAPGAATPPGSEFVNFRDFLGYAAEGRFRAAYVVGGHPHGWVTEDVTRALQRIEFLVVQDLFPTPLDPFVAVRIPSVSWAEREGTFMNCDGLVQPFERALPPIEGAKSDGQFLYELAGKPGLFIARRVREQLAAEIPEFREVFEPRSAPKHAH
ncbi:MAG: 2Fe-2S iron-sulfur cluster-binding protein [Planctomycetota bacterium]